jgi:hypothetical protein
VRTWMLWIGGSLLVASAGAHAFAGWPPQRKLLAQAGNEADLINGLALGWYFGSVAMLAFGVVVLRDARALGRHPAHVTGAAAIIGIAYAAFGLWALFYKGFNPHFIGFIVIGLLIAIPALLGRAPRP